MGKTIDMTDKKYGRLTVLEKAEYQGKDRHTFWKCKCNCGNTIITSGKSLRTGRTTSCGCKTKEAAKKMGARNLIHKEDLSGRKFGRLTVKCAIREIHGNRTVWKCECDCGTVKNFTGRNLLSGNSKSCGCLSDEKKRIRDFEELGIIVQGTSPSRIVSKKIPKNNKTGIKGVYRTKKGEYTAYIGFQKKRYYLGTYSKLEEAGKARKDAEQYLYGDFLKWYSEEHPDR